MKEKLIENSEVMVANATRPEFEEKVSKLNNGTPTIRNTDYVLVVNNEELSEDIIKKI